MNKFLVAALFCLLYVNCVSAQILTESEVTVTMYRAFELQREKKYPEALEAFLLVGANVDANKSEVERQVYVCSQTMACVCYFYTRQFDKGYHLAKQLMSGKLADSEKKDVYSQYVRNGYRYAAEIRRSGRKNGQKDYEQARSILRELLPYAENNMKQTILVELATTWYFEAAFHHNGENYEDAIYCYEQALSVFEHLSMDNGKMLALKQLAFIYSHTGHIDKSIECYEKAFSIQNIRDVERMQFAQDLCRLYATIGNLEQKNRYADLIEAIFAETNDKETQISYYGYKAKENQSQGWYDLAEQYYLKALDLAKIFAENGKDAYLYQMYFDMGILYRDLGRNDEAVSYLLQSLGKDTIISEYNYLTYIQMATIYLRKGDLSSCERCLNGLFLLENDISELRQLSKLYVMRARYHQACDDFSLALADFRKADEILASKYPASDLERVHLYAMMGGLAHKLAHYDESENYYHLYANNVKQVYGEQSLDYIEAQIYLANAQGYAGRTKAGCGNYTSAMARLKLLMKRRLPYMTASERESFWHPLSMLFTRMTPYALAAECYQSDFTKTCYDALVLSKGFLLDAERSLLEIIQREGDEIDMQTYMSIASMNNQIKVWEKNYAQYADSILSATNKISRLEAALMKRCKSIGSITSFMEVDYNVVKKSLGKNEVLIDFTDFVPDAGDRRYAAYIVNRKQKYPLLKPLFAESQIDSLGIARPDMYYDKDFAADVIELLWNPLNEHIKEGATVYYVPSQMLFQVCLESLPLEDGTLLGDHYHFVRLSSARELVKERNKSKATSAVLYGGLQYDLAPDVMAQNARQYDLSSLLPMRGGDMLRGDSVFRELPGSKVEVEKIADILNRSGFEVRPYMGMDGTEESFLNMHGQSPRILHLATHGFYYTPAEADEIDYLRGYSDAMSLSGLIMSGGNAAWRGEALPEGVLGGVLTANNIARIDLGNTDMLVLSACQTGQGNATAEGLYGLQRAFKKAGVGTMLMTLWSVSDKVATEFMIKFYEALAENNWDKHKAFEQTKSYIRTQHPDPYHWAAFVMLD